MCPHLYKRPCPLVGRSVGWSLVGNAFVKINEKWTFTEVDLDLDSAGRGGRRDEEEGGTRRKKGREEQGTRRVKK